MAKQQQLCPTHDVPLTYSRKERKHFCKECLYASFLTHQAQQESVKRYRQSAKGKEAERRYEQSDKGKEARRRYLDSPKYKERRKEYNQRLQESLRIARAVLSEKATAEKDEERQRTTELIPLIQDIREYIDTMGVEPSPQEVAKWSKNAYQTALSTTEAEALIKRASRRRGE